MSASDLAISVRGLSKAYVIHHNQERRNTLAETVLHRLRDPFRRSERETFWALKDVSFDVKKGEIIGVIGRNGAGKSTLLKIMSRITEPTRGEIDLYGRIGSLLEVGTGFHPELTGRENVYLNGSILGMRRSDITKQFDAIVGFAGIEKFIDTPVKRYSSGMYVRLAFAVAAHLESDILIIDEALAVGDAEFQAKCLGKMRQVSEYGGKTVVFVSHNLAAIRQLCTCALLLKDGNLAMHGSTDAVAERYLTMNSARRKMDRQLPQETTGFTAVQIVDANGKPIAAIAPETSAFVELRLRVTEGFGVTAGFTLYNRADIPLFLSNLADSSVSLNLGEQTFRVRLPAELLQPGTYRIEGAVWDSVKVYHQEDDLHRFEVMPSKGHDMHGRWSVAHFVLRAPWSLHISEQ